MNAAPPTDCHLCVWRGRSTEASSLSASVTHHPLFELINLPPPGNDLMIELLNVTTRLMGQTVMFHVCSSRVISKVKVIMFFERLQRFWGDESMEKCEESVSSFLLSTPSRDYSVAALPGFIIHWGTELWKPSARSESGLCVCNKKKKERNSCSASVCETEIIYCVCVFRWNFLAYLCVCVRESEKVCMFILRAAKVFARRMR